MVDSFRYDEFAYFISVLSIKICLLFFCNNTADVITGKPINKILLTVTLY